MTTPFETKYFAGNIPPNDQISLFLEYACYMLDMLKTIAPIDQDTTLRADIVAKAIAQTMSDDGNIAMADGPKKMVLGFIHRNRAYDLILEKDERVMTLRRYKHKDELH